MRLKKSSPVRCAWGRPSLPRMTDFQCCIKSVIMHFNDYKQLVFWCRYVNFPLSIDILSQHDALGDHWNLNELLFFRAGKFQSRVAILRKQWQKRQNTKQEALEWNFRLFPKRKLWSFKHVMGAHVVSAISINQFLVQPFETSIIRLSIFLCIVSPANMANCRMSMEMSSDNDHTSCIAWRTDSIPAKQKKEVRHWNLMISP